MKPFGISIVKKVGSNRGLPFIDEGGGRQLWSEGAAADANDQETRKRTTAGCGDGAGMDGGGKGFTGGDVPFDFGLQGRGGGECGGAQPVMADHPTFVRIGNRTGFQRGHFSECLGAKGRHAIEKVRVKPHAAHVQREAGGGVAEEIVLKVLPVGHRCGGNFSNNEAMVRWLPPSAMDFWRCMAGVVAEWAGRLAGGFGGDVRTGDWAVVVILGEYDFGISSIFAPCHASFAGGRVVDDAGDFGGDESCGAE